MQYINMAQYTILAAQLHLELNKMNKENFLKLTWFPPIILPVHFPLIPYNPSLQAAGIHKGEPAAVQE